MECKEYTLEGKQMSTEDREIDHALLRRIQAEDERALETLYERYSRLVYSLALRIVGTVNDAEEVTQEIFLKVWKNASSFDQSKGKAFSWLVAITRRHAIDKTRSKTFKTRRNETTLDSTGDATVTEENPSDSRSHLILQEEAHIIRQALVNLAEKDRTIIELAYFEGLTHTQIAARIQLPLGTVKTRLRHGITELKKRMGDKV